VTQTSPAEGARGIGEGLTALDTRGRCWEPNGFERAFRKVLTVDAAGEPAGFISYLPGHFSSGHELPTRHLHHRIHEFSFALAGDYPIWQYESASMPHGVLTILRPGYFFSRLPGSLHGREPGPTSHVGFMSLTWRDRTGNWMFEPNFAAESAFVGYGDGWGPRRGRRRSRGRRRRHGAELAGSDGPRHAGDGLGAVRQRAPAQTAVGRAAGSTRAPRRRRER
jgi:hypothetical protein